jgi:hypothetical protein
MDDLILQDSIQHYIRHLYADYRRDLYDDLGGKDFMFECGTKYARVYSVDSRDQSQQRYAHSFIVLRDTNRFKRGDILKAASWLKPALNYARGNVFTQSSYESRVTWSGVVK